MVSKYRQTLLAACCLGVLGLFAGCYQVSVSFEPSGTEVASTSPVAISQVKDNLPNISSKTISTSTSQASSLLAYSSVKANKNIGMGTLRLSNQTNQPVRLALLSRSKQEARIPAHWDFAPQEGREKGLLLSLPDGKLQLSKGDVVVAFAQDGSRRYWGPYVVGETPFPMWNPQQKEWWLILDN